MVVNLYIEVLHCSVSKSLGAQGTLQQQVFLVFLIILPNWSAVVCTIQMKVYEANKVDPHKRKVHSPVVDSAIY